MAGATSPTASLWDLERLLVAGQNYIIDLVTLSE